MENPFRFGYESETIGMEVIRNNLLHDLACLNKLELTPWDYWELSFIQFDRLTEDELALLDHAAILTLGGNDGALAARRLYTRDPLTAGAATCYHLHPCQ